MTLALNFVANLLLIPTYGVVGAAPASSGAYVIRDLALNLVLWWRCEIKPFASHTNRTYIILPLVLSSSLVRRRPLADADSRVVLPVLLVCTGLLGLVAVAVAGGLQPEDGALIEYVESALGVELPAVGRYHFS